MIDPNAAAGSRPPIELFHLAFRTFTAGPEKVLGQRGLGRVHHRLLYFVGRNPGITVSALLGILEVSKQAVNAPLRQLIERKLIAVAAPAYDRRVKQLALTEEGKRLERELTSTQVRHLEAAFQSAGAKAAVGWQNVMGEIIARKPDLTRRAER